MLGGLFVMGKVVIMQSCRMSTRTLLTGFPLDTTVSSMSRIVTSKAECFLLKKVFPPQPRFLEVILAIMLVMTLATEYTKACGLVGAHQLVSSYICCVIGNVMRDTSTLPKGFNLPGPFPLLVRSGLLEGPSTRRRASPEKMDWLQSLLLLAQSS